MQLQTLIKERFEFPAQYSVTDEAIVIRDQLLSVADHIVEVSNPQQQAWASEIGSQMQTYVKAVREMRKIITAPMDEQKKRLITLENDHLEPIVSKMTNIGQKVTEFQDQEEKRVAREEAARQEEYRKLEIQRQEALQRAEAAKGVSTQLKHEQIAYEQAQAQTALLTAELPVVAKAKGAATREKLCFKVIDEHQVYQHDRRLCDVSVKASAVNVMCVAKAGSTELNPDTTTIPGMSLWWSKETNFRRTR